MVPETGAYSGNSSKKEFQFQMYYKHLRPNAELYGSYLTSNWPQWLFGQELPDIWDKSSLEALYYHG